MIPLHDVLSCWPSVEQEKEGHDVEGSESPTSSRSLGKIEETISSKVISLATDSSEVEDSSEKGGLLNDDSQLQSMSDNPLGTELLQHLPEQAHPAEPNLRVELQLPQERYALSFETEKSSSGFPQAADSGIEAHHSLSDDSCAINAVDVEPHSALQGHNVIGVDALNSSSKDPVESTSADAVYSSSKDNVMAMDNVHAQDIPTAEVTHTSMAEGPTPVGAPDIPSTPGVDVDPCRSQHAEAVLSTLSDFTDQTQGVLQEIYTKGEADGVGKTPSHALCEPAGASMKSFPDTTNVHQSTGVPMRGDAASTSLLVWSSSYYHFALGGHDAIGLRPMDSLGSTLVHMPTTSKICCSMRCLAEEFTFQPHVT